MVLKGAVRTVQLASEAILTLQGGFTRTAASTNGWVREIAKPFMGQKMVNILLTIRQPVLNWSRLKTKSQPLNTKGERPRENVRTGSFFSTGTDCPIGPKNSFSSESALSTQASSSLSSGMSRRSRTSTDVSEVSSEGACETDCPRRPPCRGRNVTCVRTGAPDFAAVSVVETTMRTEDFPPDLPMSGGNGVDRTQIDDVWLR